MVSRSRGVGPPASPTLLKAAELLKSGSWFDYETIIREVGKAFPPGEAIRRNERDRAGSTEKPRKLPITHERAIQAGRRGKARDTLSGSYFQHQNFAVSDGSGGVRMVRRIRMLQAPGIVLREWSRVRAREAFVASEVADELLQADIKAMLLELTQPQLLEITIELAKRQRRHWQPPSPDSVVSLHFSPLSAPPALGSAHSAGGLQVER